MNSQNPYTMPPRTPMVYSNILSDNGNTISTSNRSSMRGDKDFMHSSGIHMKHSAIYSNQYDKTFHQSSAYSINSQQKFLKPSSVHFMPSANIVKQTEGPNVTSLTNGNLPRQIVLEKEILDIKEKIGILFSYMNEKDTTITEKKDTDSEASFFKNNQKHSSQDSVINLATQKDSIKPENDQSMNFISEFVELQKEENKKLRERLDRMQKIEKSIKQDLQQMRQKVYSGSIEQIELGENEQVMVRIRNIQKSIREMGEDIHLINDKEESLAEKFAVQIADLWKTLRNFQKSPPPGLEKFSALQQKLIIDQQRNYTELKQEIMSQNLKIEKLDGKLLKLAQNNQVSKMKKKIEQINSQLNEQIIKKSEELSFAGSRSTIKSFEPPILIKFLSKFQVTHNKGHSVDVNLENITYYVDKEGYLLDNDRFYLLKSGTNQRIRLQEKHLELLRRNKILI